MNLNGSGEMVAEAHDGEGFGNVGLFDGKFTGSDELTGWQGTYKILGHQISIAGEYLITDGVTSIFGDLEFNTEYKMSGSGIISKDGNEIRGTASLPDHSPSPDIPVFLRRIPSVISVLQKLRTNEGAGN